MRIQRALEIIRFDTGTLSDISGRSINNLFSDKNILDRLYAELNQYANVTKAIEDVYSFALNDDTPYVAAPSLALRSETYKFIIYVLNGRYFPMDIRGFAGSYNNFPTRTIEGIPSWVLPFGTKGSDRLFFFPQASSDANTTTITSDITISDTTIPVTSSSGFVAGDGRITIGSEKILYGYKDSTNLYDCVRGVEQTTAAAHSSGATVTEHNVYCYYSRLHTDIRLPANSNNPNFVPRSILDTELEVAEEHLKGILQAVTYELVRKVDATRAKEYKIDADTLYEQYRLDIRKGRSRVRQGTNIRLPYLNESGTPFYTNLM